MEELLSKIYYNPLTGFQGLDKLYQKAKLVDKKITKKKVKEWLQAQETDQITKQEKKTKRIFNSIVSPSVKNNFQVDIMYLPNPTQNKFKYLLTCIDVFSRKAFVEPINTKTAQSALLGFQQILSRSGNPKNLNVDAGGEFDNTGFKTYASQKHIVLWFSNPEQENKNSIIERFHRTLRNILLKYETASKKPYINELQNLIENYNNTKHNTIKATPNEVWDGEKQNTQKINYVVYDFVVGDIVRHSVKRERFEKASSTVKYTKELYAISRIEGNGYYLNNKKGGELSKLYRGHELIKAVGNDANSLYDLENKANAKTEQQAKKLRRELGTVPQLIQPVKPTPPLKYVRKSTIDVFKTK
jgi:hypothetical protein